MACSSCKKKSELRKHFDEVSQYSNKPTIWFIVIWSVLAIYGVYALISKIL